MSKKLFITIIIVLVFVLIFVGWRFLVSPGVAPVAAVPDSSKTTLFPFGQGATTPNQPRPTTTNNQPTTQVIDISSSSALPKLRRLSIDPSVGGAFMSVSSTSEVIRFVDKATGHIIESAVDSTKQNKISNVTIPQIREVFWGDNAGTLVYRYLKDNSTIQSFYASIKPAGASSSQPIEGIFLPTDIKSMAVSNGKILYFDPSTENGRLIQANIDGSKKSIVWTSSFGDWVLSSNNSLKAFVYTRPSGTANGVGYIIDTVKSTATKVIGDVAGLEGNISPSGDYIFLSAAENSGIASASYSVTKKTTTKLTLNTLASKCVWSNVDKKIVYCGVPAGATSATYPDDWYKGSVSFSDRLWKINMETGETNVLLDPFIDNSANYDITNLVIDSKDKYISFVNKNDMTIWLLAL